MPTMTPEKQALLDRLDVLVRRAQEVTFIVPDDTGFFSIEDDLVRGVRELMRDALELMRDVRRLYDETKPAEPDLDDTAVGRENEVLREIGAAISSEMAAQEVSNMAFAARTQLMENFDALESALENSRIWVVASHADTGLRRTGKGLISLEAAIREYENLETVERRWGDLQDALEIRRLYGQFRRAILRAGSPGDAEDLARKLRSAGHRIAILRDRQIYPFLRVYDRVPIRRLQKRILAWLERAEDADKEQDGRRLWSDLVSFAELLTQINSREELREYDRRAVQRIHTLLFESGSPTPEKIPPAHLADLEKLLGRDDELDRVVLSPLEHSTEDLRAPLERLRDELEKPYVPVEETLAPLLDSGN